jgi:16S rRNA (adenine1518-N6/adenine1519-N6)-dimethyltransferase
MAMAEHRPLRFYPDLKAIREEMDKRGFRVKHRWGQNFLVEPDLLNLIVRTGEVSENDLVLEIGVGPGCLTAVLRQTGARIIGVEIDPSLLEIGQALLKNCAPPGTEDSLVWICDDFLKSKNRINPKVEDLLEKELGQASCRDFKVIANLPYCIATPALVNLMESSFPWKRMVVTMQEEVADRFVAKPGSSAYGQLTLLAAARADITRLRRVSPGSFWPKPEINSSIVLFEPKADVFVDKSLTYKAFKQFARDIFAHRRKTWFNSLKTTRKSLNLDRFLAAVKKENIDSELRAQTLDFERVRTLAEIFTSFQNGLNRKKD